jgi:SAM-dependent methyltransferase
MLHDPYRHLFMTASILSPTSRLDPLKKFDFRTRLLLDRLGLASGERLLLAGATVPGVLSALRFKLGLTGQLLVVDPRPEALAKISRYDADWAVLLTAQASSVPIMDSSVDAVLCWSSYVALERQTDPALMAAEFYRILSPRGRVLVAHTGPGAASGNRRPCPRDLGRVFANAGFCLFDTEENEELFLFKTEKIPGFSYGSVGEVGRA